LALPEVPGDRPCAGLHRAEVGFVVLSQRRGDANDDGVRVAQAPEIGCGLEPFLADGLVDTGVGDVVEPAPAAAQGSDAILVDVDSGHAIATTNGGEREGQARVAQPDNPDQGGPVPEFQQGCFVGAVASSGPLQQGLMGTH
jgi:hypothetical protein